MPVLETLAVGAAIAGPLLNLWTQSKALKEGRRESRRAERINLRESRREERTRTKERKEDIALQEKYRAQDVGFREEQFEFQKAEAGRIAGLEERAMDLKELGFENEKEMQNFNKGLSFMDRMLSQFNAKPALANNLIQISRGRA